MKQRTWHVIYTRAANKDTIQEKPSKPMEQQKLKKEIEVSQVSEDWSNGSSLIRAALLGQDLFSR